MTKVKSEKKATYSVYYLSVTVNTKTGVLKENLVFYETISRLTLFERSLHLR